MADRKTCQDVYIRVCRDSGFGLEATNAAILTGQILKVSPIQVWASFAGFDQMEEIAAGRHPAAKATRP